MDPQHHSWWADVVDGVVYIFLAIWEFLKGDSK